MEHTLDPTFETLFLLVSKDWDEHTQKEVEEKLAQLGIDETSFLDTNLRVIKRYYAAFQKRKVPGAGTKIFEDTTEAVLAFYVELFAQHPEWVSCGHDIDSKEAARSVKRISAQYFENTGQSLVEALEQQDLSDQDRWQILALLQEPKPRIELVASAIRDNRGAFEYAYGKVKAEAEVLLEKFNERLRKDEPSSLMKLPRQFDPQMQIMPSLALPLAILMSQKICFYGLLLDQLRKGPQERFGKNEVLLGAKALGDSSKLAILLELKDNRLYNLEIAKRVNLTPATTSYHMNSLMAAGFVSIEKDEGKAYYRLAPHGITHFLRGVGDMLGCTL